MKSETKEDSDGEERKKRGKESERESERERERERSTHAHAFRCIRSIHRRKGKGPAKEARALLFSHFLIPFNPPRLGRDDQQGGRVGQGASQCPRGGDTENAPEGGWRICQENCSARAVDHHKRRPRSVSNRQQLNADDSNCAVYCNHIRFDKVVFEAYMTPSNESR